MSSTVLPNATRFQGTPTNGSYYFCIEGLPSRYTWQDLKDLIRRSAAHGIWTEMYAFANGQTGETGFARVQRRDEARALYDFLRSNTVNGRRLRVHLFDISSSPPQLLDHTCGTAPCAVSLRSAAESRAAAFAATTPVAQPTSSYSMSSVPATPAMTATQHAAMQGFGASMANLGMTNANTAVSSVRVAAANPQQTSRYVTSTTGTTVNVGQGTVRTEVRGVFVSNIDFKANVEDIAGHFGKAGKILKCQLQKDPATNKSKGNATVQYTTAREARLAVDLFNNEKWMSMRLKVRLDRDHVAVSAPPLNIPRTNTVAGSSRSGQNRISTEPIIANGSMR